MITMSCPNLRSEIDDKQFDDYHLFLKQIKLEMKEERRRRDILQHDREQKFNAWINGLRR